MGLDMYLQAKKRGQQAEDIGYWRKANSIHNWFVKNVQDGIDDCDTYEVTREKLKELKKLCEKVLKSLNETETETITEGSGEFKYQLQIYKNTKIAEKLLPTQRGFFFGETRYTNYYKEDLENTIEICNEALKLDDSYKIRYSSSW